MNYPRDKSASPKIQFLNEPWVVSDIMTEYGDSRRLYSVSCLSDEKIWICGQNNILRFYKLQGELLNSIPTKSNNMPHDINVTRSCDWIYTEIYKTFRVYMVQNEKKNKSMKISDCRDGRQATYVGHPLMIVW